MRLAPLPSDEWDDAVLSALRMMPEERRNPAAAGNAICDVRQPPRPHPVLSHLQLLPADAVDAAAAPARARRAAGRPPHRTAHTSGTNTSTIGKKAGLTDDDIAALQRGEAADEFDGTILTAVDELVEKTQMSDETWAALGERWDKRQLMDFVFTVGGYHMLAMAPEHVRR